MIFLLPLLVMGEELTFCRVEVKNEFPIERGFITEYLHRKVFDTLIETGWKKDCSKPITVVVKVKDVSFEGSSISGNRFSGYTLRISFDVELPKKTYSYSLSRYVALPDPSLGTLKIRSALVDLLDTYQIKIKRDLLYYQREVENRKIKKNIPRE